MPAKMYLETKDMTTVDDFCQLRVPAICNVWAYRIVLELNGLKKLLPNQHGYSDYDLAQSLGLDAEPEHYKSLTEVRNALKKSYREYLCQYSMQLPPVMERNLLAVAKIAKLNKVERDILAFLLLSNSTQLLFDALDLLGPVVKYELAPILSVILKHPIETVRAALSQSSVLMQSGLVFYSNYSSANVHNHFEYVSSHLPDLMMAPLDDPIALLKELIAPSKAPCLSEKHYQHINEQVTLLKRYLKQTLKQGAVGVNVLLYGPPGTGKTQLCKVLASSLNQVLYEVSCSDYDGTPVSGMARLKAARAAQLFLATGNHMLLFDEVEDVFQQNPFSRSGLSECKGWINQLLENNKVPTFWVSNNISSLDNAYIRRFDMVLELTVPPAKQRAEILQQTSDGLLSKEEALALTRHRQLSPAVITRASKVVQMLGSTTGETAKKHFRQLTEATLKAQGCKVGPGTGMVSNTLYDPTLTQADCDLNELTQGLQQAGAGRLCLYGPPGTGKTAFGHYLAKTMGKELLVKRGSDLISCWVGATEKAIAEAFAEATANNSILLMDEVDSFLQERSRARNSWEITGVNEMLTQMEAFEGIFIASTNLMHNLDKAAFVFGVNYHGRFASIMMAG